MGRNAQVPSELLYRLLSMVRPGEEVRRAGICLDGPLEVNSLTIEYRVCLWVM